jgi:hypothetical protein
VALPALTRLLEVDDYHLLYIARTFWKAGVTPADAVGILVSHAVDPNEYTRKNVLRALGHADPLTDEIVELLVAGLDCGDLAAEGAQDAFACIARRGSLAHLEKLRVTETIV